MARYRRHRGGLEDSSAAPAAAKASPPPPAPEPESGSDEEKEEKPAPTGMGGRRRSRRHRTMRPVRKGTHVKAKTLRRLLKSKGLKTSGKKSTLRARAREAHLIRGGMGLSY